MKVMVWVMEANLELLHKREIIQYWLREPGDQLQVVQVELTHDEFIRLKDNQPKHYNTSDHMRFMHYSGTHDYIDEIDEHSIGDDEGIGIED